MATAAAFLMMGRLVAEDRATRLRSVTSVLSPLWTLLPAEVRARALAHLMPLAVAEEQEQEQEEEQEVAAVLTRAPRTSKSWWTSGCKPSSAVTLTQLTGFGTP